MTIIQLNRGNIWLNRTLGGLIVLIVFVAFWLVSLYTRLVDLNHSISEANRVIGEVQTANSELKDKIFALLDRSNLEALAVQRQLLKERTPQYLEVNPAPLMAAVPR